MHGVVSLSQALSRNGRYYPKAGPHHTVVVQEKLVYTWMKITHVPQQRCVGVTFKDRPAGAAGKVGVESSHDEIKGVGTKPSYLITHNIGKQLDRAPYVPPQLRVQCRVTDNSDGFSLGQAISYMSSSAARTLQGS